MEKGIRDKNFGDVDFRQFDDRVLDISKPNGITYPSVEDISNALNGENVASNKGSLSNQTSPSQVSVDLNTPLD
jgi:hypothetical protein